MSEQMSLKRCPRCASTLTLWFDAGAVPARRCVECCVTFVPRDGDRARGEYAGPRFGTYYVDGEVVA